MLKFDSQMRHAARFEPESGFSQDEVKNEPMFFNSDLRFAYAQGGPITKAFVEAFIADVFSRSVASGLAVDYLIDKWGHGYVFDSRVHMLMKGWYPCIPGYHHDDVARTRADGQPNYIDMPYKSNHCMGLVNGDICPTLFALGRFELEEPPLGSTIYRVWHPQVSASNSNNVSAPSGVLIHFDWQSFHTGQQANAPGWRWFGRVSWNTPRVLSVTNELRRQVQVYMPEPEWSGW